MRLGAALYDMVQQKCVSTRESRSKLWYIQAVEYYVLVHKSDRCLYVPILKDIHIILLS